MLAVAGGKGGCGTTTTTLGLARALASAGADPLVVDADTDMPDVHHVAGIDRTYGVDAVADGRALGASVERPSALAGVSVLTAGRPAATGPALRAVHEWPGPVLVDSPAGIGPDAIRPLRAADATLVVTTDEPQSLEDSRRTVTAARQLAPPVGALVRSVHGTGPERLAGCPTLVAVPTVSDPLADPTLARAWDRLADQLRRIDALSPPGSTGTPPATPSDRDCVTVSDEPDGGSTGTPPPTPSNPPTTPEPPP